jgi:hypothetical protein
MGDDAELEEGEACACGDDTAFVDPDVALSYIVSRLSPRLARPLPQCRGSALASGPGTLSWCVRNRPFLPAASGSG